MEGGQKLLSPFLPQRHSAILTSSSQVGWPMPAAKWATAVSEVMIRSSSRVIQAENITHEPQSISQSLFAHEDYIFSWSKRLLPVHRSTWG